MTATSISMDEYLASYRDELHTVIYRNDGSLRINPCALGPLSTALTVMWHAGNAGNFKAVSQLGTLVRAVVASEFMKAGGYIGPNKEMLTHG